MVVSESKLSPEKLVIRADSYLDDSGDIAICAVIEDGNIPEIRYKRVPKNKLGEADTAERYVYSILFAAKIAMEMGVKEVDILTPRKSIAELTRIGNRFRKDFDVVDKKYWYKLFRVMELFDKEERIINVTHDTTTATLMVSQIAKMMFLNSQTETAEV